MPPLDHKTPLPPLHASVDMISYSKATINAGSDNDDKSSDIDDDRDGDYKQVECSDDDDDLNLTGFKPVVSTNLFDYSEDEFDHHFDEKELDEDAKRIEYADSS
jgi:hypothetical protein